MGRIIRAALLAIAAGALVAVNDPAPAVDHDFSLAVSSAADLTANLLDAARYHLLTPGSHLA